MKSCIAFIRDDTFSRVPRSRLLMGEISVTEIIFVSYEHNFPAWRENLLFTLYKTYVTAGNFTRQGENISPMHMNRTKLFYLSKCFLGNRDKFCSYEQTLTDFNSAHKRKNRSLNYIALSNMTLLRWLWPNWKPSLTLILKHFLLKLPGQKKRRCQHHLRYLFSAYYRFSASNLYFDFAKIVKSFQRVDEQTTEKYRELERYCTSVQIEFPSIFVLKF